MPLSYSPLSPRRSQTDHLTDRSYGEAQEMTTETEAVQQHRIETSVVLTPRHSNGLHSAEWSKPSTVPFHETVTADETSPFLDVDLESSKAPSWETGVGFSQALSRGGQLFRLFSAGSETKSEIAELWRKAGKAWDRLLPRIFPALAVLQWWFFNVLLVLLNKCIFQVYHFNFPLTLTAIHFAISFAGAYLCIRVFHMKSLAQVSGRELVVRVLPMAVVTNLNVCLGNVSLRFIPVTFMQTVKAFTPATTVALQMLFLGKSFDLRIFIALIPVVGGVTLASATELSFHTIGFLAALTSTIFTSANSILAEVLLKGQVGDMDSINTVYYMAPQIFFMLTPLALLFERDEFVQWHYNSADTRTPAVAIFISGVLAFGLNFSLFYAIQATSAMTFNVAGNLKVAVAMLLGWMIYRNPMSMYSTLGCGVTVAGCTWYGYIQHQVSHEQLEQVEDQRLSTKPIVHIPNSPRSSNRNGR